jgi:hypothetical protein
LARDARGEYRSFFVALESDVIDALFVDLVTDQRDIERTNAAASPVTLEFVEQQKGLAL